MGDEIQKWFKIILLIDAALILFTAVYRIGFSEQWAAAISAATGVPTSVHFVGIARAEGIVHAVVGAFILLAIKANSWEKNKLFVGFLLVFHVAYVVINAIAPIKPAWEGIIIYGALAAFLAFGYCKQSKS
ncbi:MAG: hypothetical protein ACFFCS_10595 [Candidatus Hodarchaeota archaeon]